MTVRSTASMARVGVESPLAGRFAALGVLDFYFILIHLQMEMHRDRKAVQMI
jgi:hypothetical protein